MDDDNFLNNFLYITQKQLATEPLKQTSFNYRLAFDFLSSSNFNPSTPLPLPNVFVGKKTSLKRQKKSKNSKKHVIYVNAIELVRDSSIHVINVKKHRAKFTSRKTCSSF